MNEEAREVFSKVPQVTLVFWIIKIAATTLGETGGDALSMTLNLGYALSTVIFFGLFLVLVVTQVRAKRFHPYLYWAVIVGTTLAGTTLADFADRSLGIGYPGGSSILACLVIASLVAWRLSVGTVSVNNIVSPKAEMFYWVTILFSNTLGTALGDWTSEGTGFGGGVFLFLGLIAVVGRALHLYQDQPHHSFLGCLRADSAAGRDHGRSVDQAACTRRAQPEPHHLVGGDCGLYPRLHHSTSAEGRQPSRRGGADSMRFGERVTAASTCKPAFAELENQRCAWPDLHRVAGFGLGGVGVGLGGVGRTFG